MKFILFGTPIGRLNDVSISFLETISNLEYLAVEDTRHAQQFLKLLAERFHKYNLWPKKLLSAYRENERQSLSKVLELLEQGASVGYMSDAGMPAISDPGSYLVSGLRKRGVEIEIMPGPSALTTALSLSGYETSLALFLGFLPKKINHLFKLIESLQRTSYEKSANLVFFESPHRIQKTVQIVLERLPNAKLFLGRELTKKYQQLLWIEDASFPVSSLITKGEYTGVLNFKML